LVGDGGTGSAIFVLGASTASWGIGRALRSRRALAQKLEGTAERIAVERGDRVRLAVADERSRIARELQAVVAREVSTMVVQSQAAQRLLDTDPIEADEATAAIVRTGRDALSEMRRILGVLRDPEHEPDLAPQPGVGQLHALIERARAEGRHVELRVQGGPRPLPASADLGIYRILEEALAGTRDIPEPAPPIVVVLGFDEAGISLAITGRSSPSWPTVAMRERVALCDGEVHVDSVDGSERLRVRIPDVLEGALAAG
ncbi:MAG TPA: histidine kinase, partial [Solirubrobacteraceae bacterium]